MINVSSSFKNELLEGRRNFLADIKITTEDGIELLIDNSNLMQSGLKIEDAVTSAGTFQVGSAMINKAVITINNMYDDYTNIDFRNAKVVINVGLELPDNTIERVKKGIYTVTNVSGQNSSIITLECLDNLYKFDRDYSESNLTYPATIRQIIQDACDNCGVVLGTSTFDGEDYIIEKAPDVGGLTFRAVVMYAAQIIAKWAKCDVDGRLTIDWYRVLPIMTPRSIVAVDGKIITNKAGNPIQAMVPATKEDFLEGNILTKMHRIESYFSENIALNDSVITGVQIYETIDDVQIPYLYGSKGYVVTISDNKLIAEGKEREVAKMIGDKIIGLQFRQMTLTTLSDPTIEAGDMAYVINTRGDVYHTFINNTSFVIGNSQTVSCEAEIPAIAESGRLDVNTQIKVDAENNSAKKLNNYKMTVELMTSIIANSLGMFTTNVKTENGGHIMYQHNKPLLEESDIIWIKTEQGFMVSTDGGETWNAGIDADGNAVVNVLSAVGINFDWARGGTLTLGGVLNGNGKLVILDEKGKQVGYIDNTGVNFQKGTFSGTVSAGMVEGSNILGGTIISARNNDWQRDQKIVIEESRMEFYMPGYSYYLEEELYYAGALYPSENSNNAWEDDSLLEEQLPVMRMEAEYGYEMHVFDELIFSSVLNPHTEDNDTLQRIETYFHDFVWFKDSVYVEEDLDVSGTKSRVVKGTSNGDVLLYCQESATPYFTDIGTGIINDDGECVVAIDSIFSETINANVEYCVFLQKEGPGDLWVDEKDFMYFTVKGTPGLKFSWEMKAVQSGYEECRLEDKNLKVNGYDNDAFKELDFDLEQEEVTYADFESISDY